MYIHEFYPYYKLGILMPVQDYTRVSRVLLKNIFVAHDFLRCYYHFIFYYKKSKYNIIIASVHVYGTFICNLQGHIL